MLQKIINICDPDAQYLDLRFKVLKYAVLRVRKKFEWPLC